MPQSSHKGIEQIIGKKGDGKKWKSLEGNIILASKGWLHADIRLEKCNALVQGIGVNREINVMRPMQLGKNFQINFLKVVKIQIRQKSELLQH